MTACGTSNSIPPVVTVQSLSSQENMTSGDDTLIKVARADGATLTGMNIFLNNADVTAKFQKMATSNAMMGLLTGLVQGENLIEVRSGPTIHSSLKLTTYPIQGPILYAPKESTLRCQTDAFAVYPGGPTLTATANTDLDCAAPTRVDWVYHDKTLAGTAVWQKYDLAKPPTSVEMTTLLDGTTVPYIVRVETGVINRGIYQIAVIGDPVKNPNPTPANPSLGFNGRLVYPFGQSCGGGWYIQGTSMGPVGGSSKKKKTIHNKTKNKNTRQNKPKINTTKY
jgi:hypothetical protein